ncbi:MAG: hypothetical protein ACFFD1_07480 [Candidatus Thorarchaeota archaeon]
MYNFQSRMRLLSLFSIFFVYMAISRLISSDILGFYVWLVITVVYLGSLVIFYMIFRKTQEKSAT